MMTRKNPVGLGIRVQLLFSATAFFITIQTAPAQQSILGRNLIVNGDAESGPAGTSISNTVGSIPGWARTGNINVLSYNQTGYLLSTSPGPADRGFQYFIGSGPTSAPWTLAQDIDVSAAASGISAGSVKFSASAFLGSSGSIGTTGQAQMAVAFKTANAQTISITTLGPLGFPGSGLTLQQMIGLVPVGTVRITVTLSLLGSSGRNAAADGLSLVLTALGTSPGSVLGRNLVVNGDAESGPGVPVPSTAQYVPGWSTLNGVSVAPYGGTDWIGISSPGPVNRGVTLFCGHDSANAYQDIDVSAAASLIDANQVAYQISAWLGGNSVTYNTILAFTFYDWSGRQLAAAGQLAGNGNGVALYAAAHSDPLPPGTRRVRVEMTFPASADYDIADNIAFVLTAPNGPPVIDPGGIVSASAFGASTTAAAGSWVEIYGINLATTTRGWTGDDFNNGVGPTSLGGVSVLIGGQPAFVDYVSPGQVNALVPSNALNGVVPVSVTTPNGVSDSFYLIVNPTQPSLLAPSSFIIGGKQYIAGFLPDGKFALPAGSVTGVASRPAVPGETVVFYGIGFGPVSDSVQAGTLATQNDSLATPLQFLFGATQGVLAYAGLANGYTGLYQINVVVPKLANNTAQPITVNLGPVKGAQTLYIAVQN